MKLRASYSLLNRITAGDEPQLPALEPLIARWHGTRIRRIDRYIQLCVAGGLNCVEDRQLAPTTGVYLASRCGAMTTSAKAMVNTEQLGDMPKPLHFVNTLGNSAGYYLTHLLGLTGNTLMVSQEHLSFEAALLHAWVDLQQGRITEALVGGFDEVALPLQHHLERLEAPPGTTTMTEGSHWLLLEREAMQPAPTLGQPQWFNNQSELAQWLAAQAPFDRIQTSFTPDTDEKEILKSTGTPYSVFAGFGLPHGVFSGAALVALSEAARNLPGQRLLHLTQGGTGPYCALPILA